MTNRHKHFLSGLSLLLMAGVAALLGACSSDVDNVYSDLRAFFRFTPVTAAQPLRAALQSPGEYCIITFTPEGYQFAGTGGNTATYPRTAVEQYGRPLYVSGFIVGTPNVPDFNGNFYQVAYDLVCPNCYEEAAVQRAVAVTSAALGQATCSRCHRVYDLQNSGIVQSGEQGTNLYRYRISYTEASNTMVIQN